MTISVAIETSGSKAYVYCHKNDLDADSIKASLVTTSFSSAEQLDHTLRAGLDDLNASISSINNLIFGFGPGSFTGLRIGLSFIKGLALGLGINPTGISSCLGYAFATLLGSEKEPPAWIYILNASSSVEQSLTVTSFEISQSKTDKSIAIYLHHNLADLKAKNLQSEMVTLTSKFGGELIRVIDRTNKTANNIDLNVLRDQTGFKLLVEQDFDSKLSPAEGLFNSYFANQNYISSVYYLSEQNKPSLIRSIKLGQQSLENELVYGLAVKAKTQLERRGWE